MLINIHCRISSWTDYGPLPASCSLGSRLSGHSRAGHRHKIQELRKPAFPLLPSAAQSLRLPHALGSAEQSHSSPLWPPGDMAHGRRASQRLDLLPILDWVSLHSWQAEGVGGDLFWGRGRETDVENQPLHPPPQKLMFSRQPARVSLIPTETIKPARTSGDSASQSRKSTPTRGLCGLG